jgi:hypothetical protein
MKSSVCRLAVVWGIVGLVACGPSVRGDDGVGGDDTGSGSGSGSNNEEPKQCHKMDIVFIVDDSGSMQEEQTNLGQNFPMFASLLSAYTTPDGLPIDYRVAVTTTARDINYTIDFAGMQIPFSETGDNGAFKNNCNVTRRWLEPTDANMNQALTCRANVGTGGSGMEMPLLMTKWALGNRIMDGTNAGFLRDDALLAVVILTDEDDSSTEQNNFVISGTGQPPVDFHPTDAVQFLDALKGHRSRWATGIIAGPTDCTSSFGDAVKATRLQDFVTQANSSTMQASFSSICDGDLTIGLKQALDLFQTACGTVIF